MKLFDDADEQERDLLEGLKAVHKKYPFDEEKDLEMLRAMHADFPTVDLREMMREWKMWVLDHDPKKGWNWRLRFRNWVKNNERYSRERAGHNGRVGRRYNAAGAEAFSSTGEAEKW